MKMLGLLRIVASVFFILLPLRVDISEAQFLVLTPAERTVVEGEDANFTCAPVISVGSPVLNAISPGETESSIAPDDRVRSVRIDQDGDGYNDGIVYTWLAATREDHEIRFFCQVGGGVSNVATLSVNYRATIVLTDGNEFTIGCGNALNVPFSVDGRPTPSLRLTKDGNEVDTSDGLTSDGFSIPSVEVADAGEYVLTATNDVSSITASFEVIVGCTPPSFPDPDQPQNQFVFERDDDNNPVTLTFQCPVAGDPLTDVTWYRGGVVDNVYRAANGSYVFPNITAADSAFADGDGVEYYCTATNVFGTIRSRTVRAFYADFKGFEDGPEQAEVEEFPDPTMVDVIVSAGEAQRWVALNCTLNPGSTPPPEIEWVQRDTGGGGETVLDEDTTLNRVRFIDDKQWLILETIDANVDGKEYFCRVTNKERFQIVRGPLLYALNPVTEFDMEEYQNGVRIYKPLTNKTAPRVPIDAVNPQPVVFGTGIAFGGGRTFLAWSVNGRDERVNGRGAVGDVLPVSLEGDDSLILEVELQILPEMFEPLEPLVAYLHLLDSASITDPTPESVPDSLTEESHTFTCSVAGSPLPTVTFYHNGVPLEDGGAITISGGTLTISPTAENHSGMYQCLVENQSGADIATWSLQVRAPEPPTITSSFGVSPDPCLGYPIIQQDAVPFTLSVTLTADPCPTASWTFNGEAITSGGDITISNPCTDDLAITQFTFTLTVNDFEGTIGNYAVTFSNPGGSASVTDNFVTDRVRADIDDAGIRPDPYSPVGDGSGELCLLAGSTVKIVCPNTAFPVAEVSFFKSNNSVELTGRVTKECDTLTISSVEESDRGSYSCEVDNDETLQAEDRSNTIELEYCIAAAIVADLVFIDSNPDEGGDTAAVCEWTGSPMPEVTWFKNGEPLDEETLPSRIRIILTSDFRSELQIREVELNDTGDYVCNVSNPVGFDTQVKRLEVIQVVAPAIVADLVFTDSNPDEGEDTSAVCEWTGSPIPEVTWFKNGEPLDEETLPSRIRIILTNDFRSELQIREVELDDTGDYVCNVSNLVGFDYQVERLEVIQVVAVAAPIVADLVFTDSNPDEGDDTAAVCEWIGSPIPDVTWFKNGEPLDEETLPSRIRIILTNDFRSELQIREVELDDTGDYVCNVSSPVGFDFRVATLEVRGPSDSTRLSSGGAVAIGLSVLGLFIFLSVITVTITLCCWRINIRKSQRHQEIDTDNAALRQRMEMKTIPNTA